MEFFHVIIRTYRIMYKSIDSVLGPRTRRLLQRSKSGVQGTAKVLSMLQSVPKVKKEEPEMELGVEPGDTEGGPIILDTIAEFCRQVGEKEEGERG